MSMYGLFKTDPKLETNGIIIEYDSFRVTVARAGGANKRFARVMEKVAGPYRRAIDTETISTDRANDIIREVYAEAVVLKWEVRDGDKWKEGIESPSGEILPATKENILQAFKELPELFQDIQSQAQKVSLFREVIEEQDSKN